MDMKKLIESVDKFAGEPTQKPGDQVRGTNKAKKGGKKHPFAGRLVGDGDGGDGGGAAEESFDNKKSLIKELNNYAKNNPHVKNWEPTLETTVEENLTKRIKKDYKTYLESLTQHPKRQGLEGPFKMRSGKVVYYETNTGRYIDADNEQLNEYGPVGTDAPPAPPQNQATVQQQKPDMKLNMQAGNVAQTGTMVSNAQPAGGTITAQQPGQPVQQGQPVQPGQPGQPVQQGQQAPQTPQQASQAAAAQNQAAGKASVGPQDIAMGFLKGMGVQNPQQPAVDALAKSLGKNLKGAK